MIDKVKILNKVYRKHIYKLQSLTEKEIELIEEFCSFCSPVCEDDEFVKQNKSLVSSLECKKMLLLENGSYKVNELLHYVKDMQGFEIKHKFYFENDNVVVETEFDYDINRQMDKIKTNMPV